MHFIVIASCEEDQMRKGKGGRPGQSTSKFYLSCRKSRAEKMGKKRGTVKSRVCKQKLANLD